MTNIIQCQNARLPVQTSTSKVEAEELVEKQNKKSRHIGVDGNIRLKKIHILLKERSL